MASAARIGTVGMLLLAAVGLWAAPPTAAEIAKAVKQLADDDFDTRQKASAFLRAAGRAAETALEEAAKSNDTEVSRRAREILDEFKWGIYPDTPPKIAEQIQRYRNGDNETKLQAVRELLKLGPAGLDTVRKFTLAEENIGTRREVLEDIARYVSETIGEKLLADDHATLERLLEIGLAGDRELSARNYAAWLAFRGKLDDKVPHYKALAQKDDARAVDTLFFLCRAKGDFAAARWAAEQKSANPRLLHAILAEAGDWKELARLWTKRDPANFGVEGLTFTLAYHRLAGNAAERDQAMTDLRKFAEDNIDDGGYVWLAAKGLFLNDRPAEALALLDRGKHHAKAFDILAFQSQFQAALTLADKAPEDKSLQLGRARVLHLLGQREKARSLLAKLGEEIEDRDQYPTAHDLLRLQMRLGLKDDALAYAAGLLRKDSKPEVRDALLGILFPDPGPATGYWWLVLRHEHTAEETATILKKLAQLFEGRVVGKDLDALLKKAEEVAATAKEGSEAGWQQALAEACVAAKQADRAIAHLEQAIVKAPDSAALLRLADLLAEKKAWNDAARRYRQAWDKDRTQPLPLFLHGWALGQAGKEAEGRKAMQAAHEMPLGSESVRYQFAKALAERGHPADAQRERELILRVGTLEGWAINETLRQLAYAAQQRKEYLQAAEWFEKFRLRCMRVSVSFVETSAHVQVPAMTCLSRARGLIAAGKFDEARKEWELALKLVPGNVNVPIALVPALVKAGRQQDADALFGAVFDLHARLCKEHPESASSHNTLAWLAGVCRRKLDIAEEHASTATKLEPSNAGYLDTLAEVHFQRGNQARAIELMKRCLALEPKNAYFRKQLQRFEAGDPKTEVPDEGE